MSKIDTSTAAVERMAKLIAMHGDDQDTAALSALLARTKRAEAARDTARFQRDKAIERAANAETERDAARAEAARLRAELLRVVEHADMAPELYASDTDVWRGMAGIARAALLEDGR